MRDLTFTIDGQELIKEFDFKIVKGTRGYLRCVFRFVKPSDWTGFQRIAIFETNNKAVPVPISTSNCCTVPDDVADHSVFKIRVVGGNDKNTVTTNKILIEQR